jgi:hypothetical protein
MIFYPMICLAKPCTYLASRLVVSPNRTKRASPLRASKMISEPMVHLVQTVHLSCTDTNTVSKMDGNKIPQDPCHLGVPSGAPEPISDSMVRIAQTCTYLRQDYHCLQQGQNELPLERRPLGVSSGASKMISEPMVRLAQTVHLSCTDTNTISKWTGTGLHMTHVT